MSVTIDDLREDNPQPNPPGQRDLQPGEEYLNPLTAQVVEEVLYKEPATIGSLPDTCPSCEADLLEEGAVEQVCLTFIYYRGRVFSGGFATDWSDQDRSSESDLVQGYDCRSCGERLSPPEQQGAH